MTGPQTFLYNLSAPGDTLTALGGWHPRYGTNSFLSLTVETCNGPYGMPTACTTPSRPMFDPLAGWTVKGRSGSWMLEIDSVRYVSTPTSIRYDSATASAVLVPATSELVIRPRWIRLRPGAQRAKWTDSVTAPAWTESGFPGLDPRKAKAPILRWIGKNPGRRDNLRCQVRDGGGKLLPSSGRSADRLAALLWRDRDSSLARLGGEIRYGLVATVQPLTIPSPCPTVPVVVPTGAAWDLETSLGWFGAEHGMHAPEANADAAPGWTRSRAT